MQQGVGGAGALDYMANTQCSNTYVSDGAVYSAVCVGMVVVV